MIGDHVLDGFGRVVAVVGPILVVMVALFLPVQRGVLHVGQSVDRRTRARERHRLPQHGKQHDEEDGRAAHSGRECTEGYPASRRSRLQSEPGSCASTQVTAWFGIRDRGRERRLQGGGFSRAWDCNGSSMDSDLAAQFLANQTNDLGLEHGCNVRHSPIVPRARVRPAVSAVRVDTAWSGVALQRADRFLAFKLAAWPSLDDPYPSIDALRISPMARPGHVTLCLTTAVVRVRKQPARSCHSRRLQGFVIGQLASAAQSEKLR